MPATKPCAASSGWRRPRSRPASCRTSDRSAACSSSTPRRGKEPVLVSSADGVGTKLKVAFMANQHRTIGADLVNHCVNDILVQGATPLFFLDYLATGRLSPDVAEQIVEGLAQGLHGQRLRAARRRDGGDARASTPTANTTSPASSSAPSIARRSSMAARSPPGDVLIGLPSNGLHTNGYSLARKIAFDELKLTVDSHVPELGETVGDAFLRTHRSYLPVIKPLLGSGLIKGMAHITGGGITDNLPRVLPAGHRGARQSHRLARAADLPLAWRGRPRPRVRPSPRPEHGHRPDPRRRSQGRRRGSHAAARTPARPTASSSATS